MLLAAGPDAPKPERIVDDINAGRPPAHGLGEGNPNRARLGLSSRAAGRAAEWIRENPESLRGRIERFIILRYRGNVNTSAIRTALENSPMVESVGFNLPVDIHAGSIATPLIPNDGLLGDACGEPLESQWGLHEINLFKLWRIVGGGAGYLGLVDLGAELDHPDLRATHRDAGGALIFDGGNLRAHISRDVDDLNCSVEERDPLDDPPPDDRAGHGTMVAGIAAATTNNQDITDPEAPANAAGVCWHCSLMLARAGTDPSDAQPFLDVRARGLDFLAKAGAQVVSMSFGVQGEILSAIGGTIDCEENQPEAAFMCGVLALAEQRDVLMTASAGNWKRDALSFPARDPRVVGVGGVQLDQGLNCTRSVSRWLEDRCSNLGWGPECGSNIGPTQELVWAAKSVIAPAYTNFDHNPGMSCGDLQLGLADGYGVCTGTSMASPGIAALLAMIRMINPLLPKDDVRDIVASTASHAASRDLVFGFGLPDAEAAGLRALGRAVGCTLPNRLTPLLSFFSPLEQTHAYTTVPSLGTSWIFEDAEPFDSIGPRVPGYDLFPGFGGPGEPPCTIPGCQPRASVYVFTTSAPPFPGAPRLVPLYRMRYDSAITPACPSPPTSGPSSNRDFAFATTQAEVLFMMEQVADANGIAYHADGIDGFIYERCANDTCQPPGTVRLYRWYHPTRRDFAVFPETEKAQKQTEGYGPFPGLEEVIGYGYPSTDSDADGVIDGFEVLIGTNPQNTDSDCDGLSDGAEVLVYDRSNPDSALRGYGDPLDGPCSPVVFRDGFETGGTSRWSDTAP